MSKRRARRSTLVAWAASAVVPVVIAIARLGGRRNPPAPPPETIEIETVEIKPAELPDVPPEAPPPPPAPSRPRAAAGPAPSARTHASKAAPSRAVEAPASPAPAPEPPSPSAEPSVPAADTHKVDLSLGSLAPDVRERLAPAPPEGAVASRPRSRGLLGTGLRDVDELRAEVERAEDAAANVASGRVDPMLYDVLRGAKERFESEAKRLA